MKLSPQGIELIKTFEGCRLKAYQCSAGRWTIGYGHTGPEVRKGLVWTRQQADKAFDLDTDRFEHAVCDALPKLFGAPGEPQDCGALTQAMFDALVSFAFNVGQGDEGFGGSTMLRLLREERFFEASEEFTRWNKASGKFNKGLLKRRTREMRVFLVGY